MGWSIIEKGGPGKIPTYRKFIVDLIADLATLPSIPEVPAGSIAYCSENSSIYILEIDGDWALKEGVPDIGLENLDDVDISEPSDGDAIIYDSTTEKWVNKPPSIDNDDIVDIYLMVEGDFTDPDAPTFSVDVIKGSYNALCEAVDIETENFIKIVNIQGLAATKNGAEANAIYGGSIEFWLEDGDETPSFYMDLLAPAGSSIVWNAQGITFNLE